MKRSVPTVVEPADFISIIYLYRKTVHHSSIGEECVQFFAFVSRNCKRNSSTFAFCVVLNVVITITAAVGSSDVIFAFSILRDGNIDHNRIFFAHHRSKKYIHSVKHRINVVDMISCIFIGGKVFHKTKIIDLRRYAKSKGKSIIVQICRSAVFGICFIQSIKIADPLLIIVFKDIFDSENRVCNRRGSAVFRPV